MKVLLLAMALSFGSVAYPCSFVELGNQQDRASAQNFDWIPNSYSGIFINKRNVAKSAGHFSDMPEGTTPVTWIAKYGSISFGYGRDIPIIGVNETGLTAQRQLYMAGRYPPVNQLPLMEENQYVQYILDTSQDVSEVIQQTNAIQIFQSGGFPTHFVFCDHTANCVSVEGVVGKMKLTTGTDLKVQAQTNTEYQSALDLLQTCPKADCPNLTNSQWRFITAANQVMQFSGTDVTQGAFNILDSVRESIDTPTLWTAVTHQSALENKFYVKNTFSSKIILSVDFMNLDYSCKTPVQAALLFSNDSGSSVALSDYTLAMQKKLIGQLGTFFGVSDVGMQELINYPDQYTKCLDQ